MRTGEKVRENRLRRWAKPLGMALRKSRVRRPHLNDQGGYMIVDPYRNVVIAGERFDWGLDDVESYLGERQRELEAEIRAEREKSTQ